jgi:hypothetical protein
VRDWDGRKLHKIPIKFNKYRFRLSKFKLDKRTGLDTHTEQGDLLRMVWFGLVWLVYSCCSHLKHRASLKRFVSLQFLTLRHSVGLIGRVISPSQNFLSILFFIQSKKTYTKNVSNRDVIVGSQSVAIHLADSGDIERVSRVRLFINSWFYHRYFGKIPRIYINLDDNHENLLSHDEHSSYHVTGWRTQSIFFRKHLSNKYVIHEKVQARTLLSIVIFVVMMTQYL